MNWFKKFLIRLFKINTYESEYNKYKSLYEDSQKNYNIAQAVVETYKADLEYSRKRIAELMEIEKDSIEYVNKHIEKSLDKYEACVSDLEELSRKQEDREHKAFAMGRQAAYSEMGIWRLDALEHGNRLVMDRNGQVFELLELEDIDYTEDIDESIVIKDDEISLEGIE